MTDIRRSIVVSSSLERVWRAIVDSTEFGTWFGAEFDGPFDAGVTTTGRIVPTTIDAAVAAAQEPHRGTPLTAEVVAIEPMRRFAFRWHPVPDSDVLTLVEFSLAEEGDGVRVTITEDGFDALPAEQRDAAREGNDGGWDAQTRLLAGYLASRP
ncbi:SRPBCC family protein [Microbacterium sp. B2969]|uniref:SRPBCC family protein n=1 Tax=Microbacterium alkaliflavum TaxID=3248839 RepID=A0ABW7QCN9_9MICO